MEDLGVEVRIILKCIFKKWNGGGGGMDWNDVAQDMDQWWAVMSTVMSLSGSKKLGTFCD